MNFKLIIRQVWPSSLRAKDGIAKHNNMKFFLIGIHDYGLPASAVGGGGSGRLTRAILVSPRVVDEDESPHVNCHGCGKVIGPLQGRDTCRSCSAIFHKSCVNMCTCKEDEIGA